MKPVRFRAPGFDGAQLNDAPGFDPKDQPRWYLVQCKPREDERAQENLERQGFQCYRPLCQVEQLHRGRRTVTSKPLFPGYLFIRLDRIRDNWMPICSTRGVSQIVRFNEYPLPVANAVIEEIRRRGESPAAPEPYLAPGEEVVINTGTFAGIGAIFVANDGEERVMLLLNILHSQQTLSFPVGSVSKSTRATLPTGRRAN